MPNKQYGLSFGGFIIGAFVLVLASIVGLKLIPAYMQNAQVKNLFVTIANDPDMQRATPAAIRSSFSKRASIDDVKAIKPEDIEIDSDGTKPLLSANYAVKVPLAGNISLYMEFNPSSAAK
jgi:hypothetical protein